ncbi:hypothetical protein [Haladaptatus sp. NG-WS-4]
MVYFQTNRSDVTEDVDAVTAVVTSGFAAVATSFPLVSGGESP